MKQLRTNHRLAATSFVALATAAALALAPSAASAEEADATADGDIVVTARYKNENLQDVPIAITALPAVQLNSLGGQTSLKDLQGYTPSVNIQGYSGRNQTITIRGLGSNSGNTNDGLDQGVGIYIDGVLRPRVGTALDDLADVESIQVLRGPQGTLFGKNTVAGAIDVRTRAPSFTPELNTSLSFGNYDFVRAQASVSGPVSDTVAVRIGGLISRRDGTIYNSTYQQDWDNYQNGMIKGDILFKPSNDLSIRITGDYSERTGDMGFFVLGRPLPTTLANGATVRGFYQRAADIGYTPKPFDPYARRTDINGSQYDRMPSGGVTGRVDASIGTHTLTSITAWRYWKWDPNWDGDQMAVNVSPEAFTSTDQKQFSQEFRINSPQGRKIEYTAGLYYFRQKSTADLKLTLGPDAAKWIIGSAAPAATLDGLESFQSSTPVTNSYAAFGQATAHLTPKLSLTGGLRYTYEKKRGSAEFEQRGTAAPISSLPVPWQAIAAAVRGAYAPSGGNYETAWSGDNLSWLANLSYGFTDKVHGYVNYSRGYKSAGLNLVSNKAGINLIVKPEKVDSYELGLKTEFFDDAVRLNLAAFWTDVTNYQSNVIDLANRVNYIDNSGKVRSRGVEFDLQTRPVTGLTINASGAYLDATYRSFVNSTCPFAYSYLPACDLSGERLAGTSKWAGSIWTQYEHPLTAATVAYIGGDVVYRSTYSAAVNNDPLAQVPGYTVVGLHGGIRSADGKWDLSVWSRNLFDKGYINTIFVRSDYSYTQVALGEPRTYGLTLRSHF